jgi:DNA-binding transcriptional ArsR family regulator
MNFYTIVTMNIQNKTSSEVLEKHACLCKAMANPNRIAIVELLSEGERNVGDIAEYLGLSVSTTSQHLKPLRDTSVVTTRKEGQTVYYALKYPRLFDACLIIRSVLLEEMKDSGKVATRVDVSTKV